MANKNTTTKKTTKNNKAQKGEPTKRELCVMYHKKKMTNDEIAKAANTTINSVRWYLSKEGLSAYRVQPK